MDIALIGAATIALCGIAVVFVAALAIELSKITSSRR